MGLSEALSKEVSQPEADVLKESIQMNTQLNLSCSQHKTTNLRKHLTMLA